MIWALIKRPILRRLRQLIREEVALEQTARRDQAQAVKARVEGCCKLFADDPDWRARFEEQISLQAHIDSLPVFYEKR